MENKKKTFKSHINEIMLSEAIQQESYTLMSKGERLSKLSKEVDAVEVSFNGETYTLLVDMFKKDGYDIEIALFYEPTRTYFYSWTFSDNGKKLKDFGSFGVAYKTRISQDVYSYAKKGKDDLCLQLEKAIQTAMSPDYTGKKVVDDGWGGSYSEDFIIKSLDFACKKQQTNREPYNSIPQNVVAVEVHGENCKAWIAEAGREQGEDYSIIFEKDGKLYKVECYYNSYDTPQLTGRVFLTEFTHSVKKTVRYEEKVIS